MKRPAIIESILFVVLVASGVALRISLQDLPNFAPVAAMSLFAGFVFRSWLVAACLPISIMGISDYFIGGYEGRMMMLVHASLVLPVFARGILRRHVSWSQRAANPLVCASRFSAGVLGSSLVASCLFYLVTNFGAWLWFDMYQSSWTGLLQCYVNAIPFFRYTLAGDLFFAVILFGGYGVCRSFAGTAPHRSEVRHAA